MPEALSQLWPLIDLFEPILSAEDLDGMCGEHLAALQSLGFVVEAERSIHIVCPECYEDHIVEVSRVRSGRTTRYMITCPEAGLCEVDVSCLRQWTLDLEPIARALKTTLSLTGRFRVILPGRLWHLGKTSWQQTSRDVLFVRGLIWEDSSDVIRRIEKSTRPILLVPDQIPETEVWSKIPAIVALSQVSQLCDGQLAVDIKDVLSAIKDQDELPKSTGKEIIDDKKLKLIVRNQVKAEHKTQLTDEVLVAAYQQEKSGDKAAAFLTKQTGRTVTRDKVYRAVKRAGGIQAVVAANNSNSVRRTVASQRRDGKKIIPNRPEAVDFE